MEQFKDMLIKSFNEKVENGEVKKIVDEKVSAMIKEMAGNITRTYGEFGKALEAKLQTELIGCLERFSLEQYNDVVVQLIKTRVDGLFVDNAKKHLEKLLDKTFRRPDKKYKFSEIIKIFKEYHEEEAEREEIDEFTLHVDNRDRITFVYLDSAQDVSDYKCAYRLVIDDDDGTLISATSYNALSRHLDGKKSKPIRPAAGEKLNDFESLLFQLMAYAAPIELDYDEAKKSTAYKHCRY